LEDVYRGLILLSKQGKVRGFFNNIKNADKLGGLVEDIRDARTDRWIGIDGPRPSQRDVSHRERLVPLWEQGRVPERDQEGSLVGDRTVAER